MIEQSGPENKVNNQIVCDSALSQVVLKGREPSPAQINSWIRKQKWIDNQPARLEKKSKFIEQQRINRKLPGHCCRCGKPHTETTRQCIPCREYEKAYKARKQFERKNAPVTVPQAKVKIIEFQKRIESLEIAVANLQLRNREQYLKGYKSGTKNIRSRLARRVEGLRGEHSEHKKDCKTSLEELAAVSHVYTFTKG